MPAKKKVPAKKKSPAKKSAQPELTGESELSWRKTIPSVKVRSKSGEVVKQLYPGKSNVVLLNALMRGMPEDRIPQPTPLEVACISASMPMDVWEYGIRCEEHVEEVVHFINLIAVRQWEQKRLFDAARMEVEKLRPIDARQRAKIKDYTKHEFWVEEKTGAEIYKYVRELGWLEEIKIDPEIRGAAKLLKTVTTPGNRQLWRCFLVDCFDSDKSFQDDQDWKNDDADPWIEKYDKVWDDRVFNPIKARGIVKIFLSWRESVKTKNMKSADKPGKPKG